MLVPCDPAVCSGVCSECRKGLVQRYLDEHQDDILPETGKKWCLQVAEAIAYIHRYGVVHADLRPEKFLVHKPPR